MTGEHGSECETKINLVPVEVEVVHLLWRRG